MENKTDKMDELKQQFQFLSEKVSTQEIDNERLIKMLVKKKLSWIDRLVYKQIFSGVFCIVFFTLYCFIYKNISQTIYLFTVLFIIVDVIFNFKINKVKNRDWMDRDLLSTQQSLIKMKKNRHEKFLVELPLGIVWGICLAYDIMLHITVKETALLSDIFWGILIFFMTLAIFNTIRLHKKMQRTNEALIREIEKYRD